MEKEIENKKRDLQQWLLNLVDAVRARYDKLDESSRFQFTDVDLRDKCQIEVFWLEYPENQVIVFTFNNERDDREILIHGPSKINPLLDAIAEVMQTERWNRPISADVAHPTPKGSEEITYSQAFKSLFKRYVQTIRRETFELSSSSWESLGHRDICTLYRGNIAEDNYTVYAILFLNIFTRDPFLLSETLREQEIIRSSWPKGHGSYFYPPIWIGKKPEKDFKLEALGTDYIVPEAFNLEFSGRNIVINSNGFVGLQTDDKKAAQRSLNIIFGIAALSGIDCFKANESDVQEIQFEPKSSKIFFQSELPYFSLRSYLSGMDRTSSISELRDLPVEKMQEIISRAEMINSHEISAVFLLWFEAYDHFRNDEYDQSFVMNWIVIERHLYRLLTELAHTGRISENKREKLERLDAAFLLLFLSVTECIDEKDYSILAELNHNRNQFVHKGVSISRRSSKKCLEYSEGIIKKLIADAGR